MILSIDIEKIMCCFLLLKMVLLVGLIKDSPHVTLKKSHKLSLANIYKKLPRNSCSQQQIPKMDRVFPYVFTGICRNNQNRKNINSL